MWWWQVIVVQLGRAKLSDRGETSGTDIEERGVRAVAKEGNDVARAFWAMIKRSQRRIGLLP